MASIYAAYGLAAAADLGTGAKALALQTASVIYSRALSGGEAIVGYRPSAFRSSPGPRSSAWRTGALVGGLSGLQAMLSGAATSASPWGTSLGNVSMDQMQLAPAAPLGLHGRLAA